MVLFFSGGAAEFLPTSGRDQSYPAYLERARYTGGLGRTFFEGHHHQWVDEQGLKVLAPYSVRQADLRPWMPRRPLDRLTKKL